MNADERRTYVEQIRHFPAQLTAAVQGLTVAQLTTHFLPHEWTVAQNVHHLADSHMNSFIRLKLILTETQPTVRPYDQDLWATKADANNPDLESSLLLLRGLHTRWVTLFESLSEAEWTRTGVHPENGVISVEDLARTYAAHGLGHLDQIARTLAAQ